MKSPAESTRVVASLPFEPKTLLAPMEGVTSPPLRELLASGGGIGVVCTEFVRVTAQPLSPRVVARHVVRPSRGLLSVQVMGNDITQMAEATRMVTDAGAHIVDINLGCPAPKAVRKGVGSAMLKDPLLLGRVLCEMRKSTALPLSAKMRAGFDDASHVLELARVVEDSGVDFLAVHPRRRVDFYDGVADWRIIGRLARELRIPVIGNGDVWYAADALRLERETGASGVMMGRPALRNPWIFQQLAALRSGAAPVRPNGRMLVDYVRKLSEALATETRHSLLGLLKEQLRYLGRTVRDEGRAVRELCRCQSTDEMFEWLERHVAQLSSEQLDLAAEGGTEERSGSVAAGDRPVGGALLGEPVASVAARPLPASLVRPRSPELPACSATVASVLVSEP